MIEEIPNSALLCHGIYIELRILDEKKYWVHLVHLFVIGGKTPEHRVFASEIQEQDQERLSCDGIRTCEGKADVIIQHHDLADGTRILQL